MTAHGTEARYNHSRCRCALCRRAAVSARRARREASRDAARAYDRAYKRQWRAMRRAEAQATNEAAVPKSCNCLSYGHGLTMTRVARRDCPVHGERRDKFAAELEATREAERLKRERRA